MIKKLCLVIIFLSCRQARLVHDDRKYVKSFKQDENLYTVYKIDSINSFYLVYAKKKDSLYKIVSKKEYKENCEEIRQQGRYNFLLHSALFDNNEKDKTVPQSSLLVNCFYYDDSTFICLERDSINDLHYADNIKGLCLVK